jgi:hypothetical protein
MRIDRSKVFTAVLLCFVALTSASYAHASNFTIGGTVTGLISGTSVTLLDNGANPLKVTVNGKFTFTTAIAGGAGYNVTVSVQPTGETCTVTGGSGTVGTANVTTVKVACKAATFTIGGTVSGLITGRSGTLLNNGGTPLKITKNGGFTFTKGLTSGSAYKVTISVQPAGEACTVTGGSGKVGTGNVTTVKVACTANTYTIGGTLSGLSTGASVTLLDNGSGPLKVTANGAFTFATPVASGAAYKVTVSALPTGETCTVTKGAGKVVSTNVTTVVVACKTVSHTIGGTVSGLSTGSSVTLLDNGTDSLAVAANGKFTFKTALASGATYHVTVSIQPTGETCTVTGGSGTVGTANVIAVKIACKAGTFTIGGTVSGLASGTSVTLLDNGTGPLKVAANGTFTFARALASGAAYSVTVSIQPTGATCTVTGGSGTVGSTNVTTVKVACAAASSFTIGGTVSGLNSGTSVTLLDNGNGALKVSANGAFTFATALAGGAAYNVTVSVQPMGETCTVTGGSGTVGSANVTTVKVACTTAATFTIGGTVSGLNSGTSVTLLDNGSGALKVSANGAFTFATALASGATYNVTVSVQPTNETCTVTGNSGTVGSANVTTVKVACSAGSTGGGAYWIPYSATPSGATPAGKNGLFLIPSDKLSSSPAPAFVTTDTTQLLGIGTQLTTKSGAVVYSPQVLMYADTASNGTTKIFGLTLAGTSSIPTPTQISNLALPKTQQICQVGSSSSLTDITQPTTLFVLIEVGTAAQCASGGGAFEVVHYLDSATTAPVVVSVNTTEFNSIYQSGKLTALLLFDSATNSLDVYVDDTFTSPTQKIPGLTNALYLSSVLDETTLSTSGAFLSVTTTGAATELYRIDGDSLAAALVQNVMTGSINNVIQDDNNLYYMVLTPGASSSTTATFNQVALTGGTPKLLYTAPAYTNTTSFSRYQLVGSNDSVLAFALSVTPTTGGLQDPTKATATVYTVPVGTTSSTPATLANYPAGDALVEAFLAAPSGGSLSSSIFFGTVRNASGSLSAPTIAYSAVSIPLNGGAAAHPIANSVYGPLAVISTRVFDTVWQVTNITDTNGGFGGGTANVVTVSNLTDTPFTTTGGGDYVFPAGFSGSLEAIFSNNIAIGFFTNSAAAIAGTAPLQETGAAADLTTNFFYPVALQNTFVLPY